MSRRHQRVTTSTIVADCRKKRKIVEKCAASNFFTEYESEEVSHEAFLFEEVEVYDDNDEISQRFLDDVARSERDGLWRRLSSEELNYVAFLVSTTQSKMAASRYFNAHAHRNNWILKKLVMDSQDIIQIELCGVCANDLEKCICSNGPEPSELVFSSLKNYFATILNLHGDKIMKTRCTILNGRFSSSPMSHGILKERLFEEAEQGLQRLHMHCSFDGIKLHGRGRSKVWPYTLVPLDLDDYSRNCHRSICLAAMFIGTSDPTSAVHDRITKWAVDSMNQVIRWNDLNFTAELTSGNHDDSARRKIYRLKGHSASGSCPYCKKLQEQSTSMTSSGKCQPFQDLFDMSSIQQQTIG